MFYFRDFVASSAGIPHPDPLQRAQNQLNLGDFLLSATRNFQLIVQTDGDLVLYGIDENSLPPYQFPGAQALIPNATYSNRLWASVTGGEGATHCSMQDDGNLVIYNAAGTAL